MTYILVGFDKKERSVFREVFKAYGLSGLRDVYDSFYEALKAIYKDTPQLIILDLDNQEITPEEMLKAVSTDIPVIAVSIDQSMALRAFEYNVIDFLSRPLKRERVVKSVLRFNENISKGQQNDNYDLFIKDKDKLLNYSVEDVMYIEALQNYILIHTIDRSIKVHMSMKQVEQRVPKNRFARVHRSFIVNVQRVHSIKDNAILMEGREDLVSVTLSKTYRKALFSRINIL